MYGLDYFLPYSYQNNITQIANSDGPWWLVGSNTIILAAQIKAIKCLAKMVFQKTLLIGQEGGGGWMAIPYQVSPLVLPLKKLENKKIVTLPVTYILKICQTSFFSNFIWKSCYLGWLISLNVSLLNIFFDHRFEVTTKQVFTDSVSCWSL